MTPQFPVLTFGLFHFPNLILAAVLTASVVLLAYIWAGYPLLLLALRQWRLPKPAPCPVTELPTVSIIVAAHNEGAQIAAKLENCLALDYPVENVEILVASDGSTDSTDEIVSGFPAGDRPIQLLRTLGRAGKSGAQNLAVEQARGELLLFTDAGTRTPSDVLRQIVAGFADPSVGLVAPVVHFGDFDTAVSKSQGTYWRFELFLRQLESDLGILATASGAAFAIRSDLFRLIPPHFGDDCIVPLDIRLQGFRLLQNPLAIVFDEMPHSAAAELRTRIRMTARNWSATMARPALLNPLHYGMTAVGLISHKLLRWLTPFLLATILIANTLLAAQQRGLIPWALQLGFYICAAVGWWRTKKARPAGYFGYCFSFCLANYGFFLGMLKALRQQTIVAYQPIEQ